MLTRTLTALVGVAMLVDWAVIVRRREAAIEHLTRPLPLLLLVATAVSAGALDHGVGRWLVAAMLLGALGDLLLVEQTPRRFLAGLGAFLLGHLAYLASFWGLGRETTPWLAIGGVALVLALVIGPVVVRGAIRRDGPGMGAAVVVYMLALAAMVVLGSATGIGWVAVGAAVFMVSDALLGIRTFVQELPWAKLPIVVTYHVGQALIALGVLLAVV